MTAHTEPPAVAPPGEVAVGEHDGSSGFSTSFDASRSRGEATAGSTTGPSAPAAPPADGHRRSPLAWLLLRLVALYRATAPFRAPRCRFHPTCSTYAVVAIERHGARRGSWLALRRLGRCHPWNPGGVDHVPPRK